MKDFSKVTKIESNVDQLEGDFRTFYMNYLMPMREKIQEYAEIITMQAKEKELLAKELALRQKEAELATSQVERVLNVIDHVE